MTELAIVFAILLAIILAILMAVFIFASSNNSENEDTKRSEPEIWPFYKTRLMTVPEQKLYWKLKRALPHLIVLAQVQASRTIRVKNGHSFKYWFNRINRTSYDFVICNKNSFPLAVIELDDSSHDNEKRQADDNRKNKALEGAKLKLFRWRMNEIPDENAIREIFKTLEINSSPM